MVLDGFGDRFVLPDMFSCPGMVPKWSGITNVKNWIFHHFGHFWPGAFVFCFTLSLSNIELSLILSCTASLGDFFESAIDLKLIYNLVKYLLQGWIFEFKLIFRGKVGKPRFSHRRCTKAFLLQRVLRTMWEDPRNPAQHRTHASAWEIWIFDVGDLVSDELSWWFSGRFDFLMLEWFWW